MIMTLKNLNVALFPMDIKWGDKKANLDNLKDKFSNLHPDTDLLILPESFSTGFPSGKKKDDIRPFAEKNTGYTIESIKKLASQYGVAIAGSYIADSGGSLYNRAFFIEPSGEEVFADKRHLFTMAGEDKIFSKGHGRLSVRYRGWNIAMIICYDIRFPVWCRNIGNEYDLLIAVANWPKSRVMAWEQLLIARAIENESYVCGVNCKGEDDLGIVYDGSSKIVDFKGKEFGIISSDCSFVYASLNKEKLDQFREKFPAYKDADEFILKD